MKRERVKRLTACEKWRKAEGKFLVRDQPHSTLIILSHQLGGNFYLVTSKLGISFSSVLNNLLIIPRTQIAHIGKS